MSVRDILKKSGPRKLLALDGGGVGGMISIEILSRIEQTLREVHQRSSLKLCEYFDYIGGTSTGAIIAALLAWGMDVDQIREFYVSNGNRMFQRARFWRRHRSKFESFNLTRQLQEVFECETLGTDRLHTLLLLVMRNATTDSAWPVSNNPNAKFNDASLPDCNLKLPLWQLIRASTAAPTYFPAEVVKLGGKSCVFVDGGITVYNNPAFQLFKMATLEPYRLCWPTGAAQMLLVSVGTGLVDSSIPNLRPAQMHLLHHVQAVPRALLNGCLHEQDLLCRMFGECRSAVPKELDAEVGSLMAFQDPLQKTTLFDYVRYNAVLTKSGLSDLGLSDIEPEQVKGLDSVKFIPHFQRIGRAAGDAQVRASHFAGFVPDAALPIAAGNKL
jgi:predicted acylesterase/phospholipase RssA